MKKCFFRLRRSIFELTMFINFIVPLVLFNNFWFPRFLIPLILVSLVTVLTIFPKIKPHEPFWNRVNLSIKNKTAGTFFHKKITFLKPRESFFHHNKTAGTFLKPRELLTFKNHVNYFWNRMNLSLICKISSFRLKTFKEYIRMWICTVSGSF